MVPGLGTLLSMLCGINPVIYSHASDPSECLSPVFPCDLGQATDLSDGSSQACGHLTGLSTSSHPPHRHPWTLQTPPAPSPYQTHLAEVWAEGAQAQCPLLPVPWVPSKGDRVVRTLPR